MLAQVVANWVANRQSMGALSRTQYVMKSALSLSVWLAVIGRVGSVLTLVNDGKAAVFNIISSVPADVYRDAGNCSGIFHGQAK